MCALSVRASTRAQPCTKRLQPANGRSRRAYTPLLIPVPVDFGLGFFALANAGVKLDGTLGAMAGLIILSHDRQDIGSGHHVQADQGDPPSSTPTSIPSSVLCALTCARFVLHTTRHAAIWCPAPFGVRGRHIRMIGLIASMSLTVSLFVADIAFEDGRSEPWSAFMCVI